LRVDFLKEKIMKTKAAVLYEYGKPLVIDELELATPGEKEVLVKYKAAGLCHTDLSVIKGIWHMPPLPCIPGHEGAGVVQEVGRGVTRVKPGDPVLLMWVPICGQCYYCLRDQPYLCAEKDKTRSGTMLDGTYRLQKGTRNIHSMLGVGCFSEYNVVSERSVLPIDSTIPLDIAAVTGCSVITGVGAVIHTAKVKPGSAVAVMGAGGVGLNVIQGAVLANATKIMAIDIKESKLELAKGFGATHVINAGKEDPLEKVMEITNGIGADYAFEVIGNPETILTTYKMVRRGGNTVIVGLADMQAMLALPIYEIPLMEKNILGCNYGSGDSRLDLLTLLELYKAGRIRLEQLITRRYHLEEVNQGFKDLAAGKNIRGMIIY
jgi:S-(hydroxymethyl)glutathione dehydrogenase/alcohol dehydrogenase